jgi:hypothetical protein
MRARASLSFLTAVLAGVGWSPARVRAGGYELLPGGTQSVARGGAVAARPEDATLLAHNPAGLALLSGNQLMLNYDLPLHQMCEDPYGYYGWGVYQAGDSEFNHDAVKDGTTVLDAAYGRSPLPQVCNSGKTLGIPHFAWAGKLTDDLALAAGFVAPTLVAGLQYGGDDGTVETPDGPRPTPTRYQVIQRQVKFALAPSVGVAYRIMPQLQVGVAAQVTMVRATSRAIQNGISGTQPTSDWLVDLDAQDYFIPSFTAALNSKPIPALDLMVAFHWSDKFNGSGKATYETATFHRDATSGSIPTRNDPVALSLVQVGLPATLTAAARYAGLLSGAGPAAGAGSHAGLGDPMDRELWDVEVDATYSLNALSSLNHARASEDVTLITRNLDGGSDVTTVKAKDLAQVNIDRHLRDSIAIRAGGSYSVVPRRLAVDAGAFFETRGVDPAYASIDTFAFQRVGVGLGLMARCGDFDLLAAYGHIFEETLEVAPPPHQPVESTKPGDPTAGFDQRVGGSIDQVGMRQGGTVLGDKSAPSPSSADAVAKLRQTSAVSSPRDRVINAGKYTAAFNIISIGATYHF